MDRIAVRNIRLCTKDCLCLYVCPTGATDTENSIIDTDKCIGCGACKDACPSGAISLVPKEYPVEQKKAEKVIDTLNALSEAKTKGEKIAAQVSNMAGSHNVDGLSRLAKAISMSERIMAEDVIREAGFMLPQSDNAHKFLEYLIENPMEGFPVEVAKKLLEMIPNNEK